MTGANKFLIGATFLLLACAFFFYGSAFDPNEKATLWNDENKQQLAEFVENMQSRHRFDADSDGLFSEVVEFARIEDLYSDREFLSVLRKENYRSVAVYSDGSLLISPFQYESSFSGYDGFLFTLSESIQKGFKKNGFVVRRKLAKNWYYVSAFN